MFCTADEVDPSTAVHQSNQANNHTLNETRFGSNPITDGIWSLNHEVVNGTGKVLIDGHGHLI